MKSRFIRARQRGVALITALLMCVVFLVLVGALMAQMIGELQDVGAHSNSAKALNAAYAGVENMVLQIEENASGPGHVSPSPINYSYPSPSTVSYAATVSQTWNS
jgi:Tfp pilus assembly protein PilX